MTSQAPGVATLASAFSRLADKRLEIGSFISLGAGSGDDYPFFRSHWPDMDVLLVEMDPSFEPRLAKHQRSTTGLSYAICAAGPKDGKGSFAKTSKVGGALLADAETGEGTTTEVSTVDTLAQRFALRPPYFLKFDTHGAEQDILAGAEAVLEETALVMMEVYNFPLAFAGGRSMTFDEMTLHMKGLGFRCIDIFDPLYRPGDQALWQFHMLFLRSDHVLFRYGGYSSGIKSKEDNFS